MREKACPVYDTAYIMTHATLTRVSCRVRCRPLCDRVRTVLSSLPAVRAYLAHPVRAAARGEQLVPLSVATRPSRSTARELARHSEYFRRDAAGQWLPDRLPAAQAQEEETVYEDVFVHTLLRRLATFAAHSERQLQDIAARERCVTLRVCLDADRTLPVLSLSLPDGALCDEHLDALAQATSLRTQVQQLLHTPRMQRLGDREITPPVQCTNAMVGRADLRACLALFRLPELCQRQEAHFAVEEQEETVTDRVVLRRLAPLLARQLTLLRPHARASLPSGAVIARRRTSHRARPARPAPAASDPTPQLSRVLEAAWQADAMLRRRAARVPRPATERQAVVNLDTLLRHFPAGAHITPQTLRERGLIAPQASYVKILSRGGQVLSWHITAHAFSADARRRLEEAGGSAVCVLPHLSD